MNAEQKFISYPDRGAKEGAEVLTITSYSEALDKLQGKRFRVVGFPADMYSEDCACDCDTMEATSLEPMVYESRSGWCNGRAMIFPADEQDYGYQVCVPFQVEILTTTTVEDTVIGTA